MWPLLGNPCLPYQTKRGWKFYSELEEKPISLATVILQDERGNDSLSLHWTFQPSRVLALHDSRTATATRGWELSSDARNSVFWIRINSKWSLESTVASTGLCNLHLECNRKMLSQSASKPFPRLTPDWTCSGTLRINIDAWLDSSLT